MSPPDSLRRMRSSLLLTCAFLLSGIVSPAFATIRASADHSVMRSMQQGFTEYQRQNDGTLPKNWTELDTVMTIKSHETLSSATGYSMAGRYAFVDQVVAFPGEPESRILLIRKIPLVSGTDLYRRLICLTATGTIESRRCPEGSVLSTFKTAGVPLPKTDNLPKSDPAFPESTDWMSVFILFIFVVLAAEIVRIYRKTAKGRSSE